MKKYITHLLLLFSVVYTCFAQFKSFPLRKNTQYKAMIEADLQQGEPDPENYYKMGLQRTAYSVVVNNTNHSLNYFLIFSSDFSFVNQDCDAFQKVKCVEKVTSEDELEFFSALISKNSTNTTLGESDVKQEEAESKKEESNKDEKVVKDSKKADQESKKANNTEADKKDEENNSKNADDEKSKDEKDSKDEKEKEKEKKDDKDDKDKDSTEKDKSKEDKDSGKDGSKDDDEDKNSKDDEDDKNSKDDDDDKNSKDDSKDSKDQHDSEDEKDKSHDDDSSNQNSSDKSKDKSDNSNNSDNSDNSDDEDIPEIVCRKMSTEQQVDLPFATITGKQISTSLRLREDFGLEKSFNQIILSDKCNCTSNLSIDAVGGIGLAVANTNYHNFLQTQFSIWLRKTKDFDGELIFGFDPKMADDVENYTALVTDGFWKFNITRVFSENSDDKNDKNFTTKKREVMFDLTTPYILMPKYIVNRLADDLNSTYDVNCTIKKGDVQYTCNIRDLKDLPNIGIGNHLTLRPKDYFTYDDSDDCDKDCNYNLDIVGYLTKGGQDDLVINKNLGDSIILGSKFFESFYVAFNGTAAERPLVRVYDLNADYTPPVIKEIPKASGWLYVFIVFIILLVIGGSVLWYLYQKSKQRKIRKGESLLNNDLLMLTHDSY